MTTREWWQVAAEEFDPVLRLRDDYPTPGALAPGHKGTAMLRRYIRGLFVP